MPAGSAWGFASPRGQSTCSSAHASGSSGRSPPGLNHIRITMMSLSFMLKIEDMPQSALAASGQAAPSPTEDGM